MAWVRARGWRERGGKIYKRIRDGGEAGVHLIWLIHGVIARQNSCVGGCVWDKGMETGKCADRVQMVWISI